MPKVPYEGTASVDLNPISRERQSVSAAGPDAFGARAGQAYGQLGQAFGNVGQAAADIQHVDDVNAARNAQTSLSAARRGVVYGDDAHEGLLNQHGDTALQNHAAAVKELQDKRDAISKTLTNGARALFDPQSEAELNNDYDRMQQHVTTQRQVATKAAWTSSLLEANNMAAADPRNTKLLGEMVTQAGTMASNLSNADGNLPNVVAADRKAAETAVYRSAITSIGMRESAAEAEIFYAGIKDKIDGETQQKIESELKTLARADRAQQSQDRQDALREKREAEIAADAQNFQDFVDGNLDPKKLAASGATPEAKRAMLSKIEEKNRAGGLANMKSDPAMVTKLWFMINPSDGSAPQITDERQLDQYFGSGDGKINAADMKMLREEIAGRRGNPDGSDEQQMLATFRAAAKNSLSYSNDFMHIPDPKGDANFVQWNAGFTKAYREGRRAGLTPDQLLNPANKDTYLGGNIEGMRRSYQDIIAHIQQSAPPAPAGGPRVPAGPAGPQVPTGTATAPVAAPTAPATAPRPGGRTVAQPKGAPEIPPAALDILKAGVKAGDPTIKERFDAMFGPGASDRALGTQ